MRRSACRALQNWTSCAANCRSKAMSIQSKTRGTRMKITGATTSPVSVGTQRVVVQAPAETASSPAPALQSEVLQPAAQALRAMPDFDAAKVAELRDQL